MPLSSKEKVLKAAIRVFSKKGYDGASMREIAESARLTKPMIYYHFKNKKDLYLYLLEIQHRAAPPDAALPGPYELQQYPVRLQYCTGQA